MLTRVRTCGPLAPKALLAEKGAFTVGPWYGKLWHVAWGQLRDLQPPTSHAVPRRTEPVPTSERCLYPLRLNDRWKSQHPPIFLYFLKYDYGFVTQSPTSDRHCLSSWHLPCPTEHCHPYYNALFTGNSTNIKFASSAAIRQPHYTRYRIKYPGTHTKGCCPRCSLDWIKRKMSDCTLSQLSC